MKDKIKEWNELIGLNIENITVDGIQDEEMAGALLLLMIHKGYNDKVWGSKRLRYWDAFQEKIELALGATDLNEFACMLAREMSATIGCNKRHRIIASEIVWSTKSVEVFEHIRSDHEMLVTLARVMQNMIKEKYNERSDEE